MKKKSGYFSISAVARMFSIHQQTIRLYEKEGLLNPQRSTGNTRLFTQQDIERLEEIIYLTHTAGVNLAGVDMVLKLQKEIKKLQKEVNGLFKATQESLQTQINERKELLKETFEQRTRFERNLPPLLTKLDSTSETVVTRTLKKRKQ
jgi:MerR family transcriptional regulator/heat shock protein HspR